MEQFNQDIDTSTRVPINADVDTNDRDDSDFDRGQERERGRDRDRDSDRGRERERRRDRPSVRDTIRQSFDDVRQDEDQSDTQADDTRPETEVEAQPDAQAGATTPKKTAPEAQAPASWTKNAKEAWSNLPDIIKQEVTKRETDMQKGVESLKTQYKEIDEAIAPYTPVIKQFQKTPAQAVSQLFAWFDALAKNPDQAFPALLQSYRYEPARLLASYGIDPNALYQFIQFQQQYQQQGSQQQQQTNGQAPPQDDIPPAVKQYIGGLQQELSELKNQVGYHFNGLAQTFAEQNAAKTQEMLDRWASDKPYFDEVRVMMGHLLTPDPQTGQAAVPLKDGKVDLDTAYEMAIYALPDVRNRVWQEQQASAEAARKAKAEADFRAQQERANKARRASGSLTTSAPGAQVSRRDAPQKGISVRDSLKAAISELSSN